MTLIYLDVKEQKSLEKEPYVTLTKKFKMISEELDRKSIELGPMVCKEAMSSGLFADSTYAENPMITFTFAELKDSASDVAPRTFIRMTCAYDYGRFGSEYHLGVIKELKRHFPFFYLPFVSGYEFSSQIEENIKLYFDVVVDDPNNVLQACYCLLSQAIVLFSVEF